MRLKFFPVNKAKNKLLHGIGKTLKKWASKYSHNEKVFYAKSCHRKA